MGARSCNTGCGAMRSQVPPGFRRTPDDVKKALCDGFEKVINSDACREKIEAANMTYMPLNAQETNDILDSMSGNFEKIINAYLNSAN